MSRRNGSAPHGFREDRRWGFIPDRKVPAGYVRLESGREVNYHEALSMAKSSWTALVHRLNRVEVLWPPPPLRGDSAEETAEWRTWLLEDFDRVLEHIEEAAAHWREWLHAQQGVQSERERIDRLRIVAGRTPAEAAAFLAKADELEAKLNAREEAS